MSSSARTPWDPKAVHYPPAQRLYPPPLLRLVRLVVARHRKRPPVGAEHGPGVAHVSDYQAPPAHERRYRRRTFSVERWGKKLGRGRGGGGGVMYQHARQNAR